MKTEIVLTEKQKADISEIFAELTDEEKDLLSACCVLCKYGVSKRDLQTVLDLEPSVLCTQIDALLREGVLVALGSDIIFAPDEVKMTVLPIHSIHASMLNCIIEKLIIYTIPSMYIDALEVKPFFDMTEGTIDYVVEYSFEELDWEFFAKLVANYAFQYDVYGRTEIGILSKADLLVMRVLELTRTKVKDSKKLYNKLKLLEAKQWINGFHYREAQTLLEEIGSTELKSELPLFLLVKGYYYQTYGNQILAFSYLYQAYQESLINCDDFDLGFLRSFISMVLAYMCALTNDQASARSWQNKVHWSAIPSHNIISIYFHLTNGMLASGHLAETELTLAEKEITDVNPDALVLARAYYCWSRYYANLGQKRQSSRFYLSYTHRLARFGSTEGGFVVHTAGEVSRHVADNSLVTAHRLLNELDRINLKSADIGICVRLQICQAYAECLAAIDMRPLSSTYCEIALEIIIDNQPEQEEINSAANVFEGKFPSSLSETAFYFKVQKLKNNIEEVKKKAVQPGCWSREASVFKGVRKEIKLLKREFPEYRMELDVIAAYILTLSKPEKAVKWWLDIINKANGERKMRLAIAASQYAMEIGWCWQAREMLLAAMNININDEDRIPLLFSLADVTGYIGLKSESAKIWEELKRLTKGSELFSKALFFEALNAYEYEDYSKAEFLIDVSIASYEQEQACLDETFSSLLAYRSVILSGMGRYSEAKTAVLDAMKFYPDLNNKSSFNLWYDLCWYYIAIQEDSAARETLAKAKSLWGIGENQKAQTQELFKILRLPKEERGVYFQNSKGFDLD